jgi:hypothetical protein
VEAVVVAEEVGRSQPEIAPGTIPCVHSGINHLQALLTGT